MAGEEFHYPLPDSGAPSRWSGLSQDARDALAKSSGPSPAEQLLPESDAASGELSPDVRSWAEGDGGLLDAIIKWRKYEDAGKLAVPHSLDELLEAHPSHAGNLSLFFAATEALYNSRETNPDGMNIGETMHLVLIPWMAFYNKFRRNSFEEGIAELRAVQGKIRDEEHMQSALRNAILNDALLYRDDSDPATRWEPSTYLKRKAVQDGQWGIMLAQTSNEAGVSSLRDKSPDELTKNGTEHFSIAGYNVDAMGIFEWLALTLQEDPSYFSDETASWLLANRLVFPGPANSEAVVPAGRWEDETESLTVMLEDPQESENFVLPRLAVM